MGGSVSVEMIEGAFFSLVLENVLRDPKFEGPVDVVDEVGYSVLRFLN